MKLFFLTPPKDYYVHSAAPIQEQALGIRLLVSWLEENGHTCDYLIPSAWPGTEVRLHGTNELVPIESCFSQLIRGTQAIADFRVSLPRDQIIEHIASFDPDIIGVSIAVLGQMEGAIDVARWMREDKRLKNKTIILGGSAIKGVPYWIKQKRFSAFDAFVHGEGEDTILEIASGKPLHEIEGVYSLNYCSYTPSSERRSFLEVNRGGQIQHLDKLPFPDNRYDNLIRQVSEDYKWLSEACLWKDRWESSHVHVIEASRGCKFKCSFCETPGVQFRQHSPEYIERWIDYYKKTFGCTSIRFADDSSATNLSWWKEVLKVLSRTGVEWYSMLRADDLDEEAIALMAQTKVKLVRVGLESGSEKVRKEMLKGLHFKRFFQNLEIMAHYNIPTQILMITGWPSETSEDFIESAKAIKRIILMGHDISMSVFTPMPGTRVWNQLKTQGLIHVEEDQLDGRFFSTGLYAKGGIPKVWTHPSGSHELVRERTMALLDLAAACRLKAGKQAYSR